ncbi:MAG: pirin family protein [Anaerolineales bacterium]|nr:pirin family protein [Anaerolineales bacterium]
MHNPRTVREIIAPTMVIEGAGVRLRRSFAPARQNRFDPFLLLDHFAFNDPVEGPIVGFPQHPHRGIETVTYMLAGNVRHRDSIGNLGVIGPGDLQWMTSGRGILHEELPTRSANGEVNGFQLWVNLPAAQKMSAPRYQEVSSAQVPIVEQAGAKVRLMAGEFAGQRGPIGDIAIQPLYLDITLAPDALIEVPVSAGLAAYAYLFEGAGQVEAEPVSALSMLVLSDGDGLRVQAAADGLRFLLMAGQPIAEPVVPYGPFVMNTEAEIRQVFEDIRSGNFAQPW